MQVNLRVVIFECMLVFDTMALLAHPYQAGTSPHPARPLEGYGGGRRMEVDSIKSTQRRALQQSPSRQLLSTRAGFQDRKVHPMSRTRSKSEPRTLDLDLSTGSRDHKLVKRVHLSRENLLRFEESSSIHERNPYHEHNMPSDRTEFNSFRSGTPRPRRTTSPGRQRRGSGSLRHRYHRYSSEEENGNKLRYILSRPDLIKLMQEHPDGDLGHDLNNPHVLGFLEKHHDVVKVMSTAAYHDYQNGAHSPRKKGNGPLRKVGQHVSGYFRDGEDYLHPHNGATARDLERMHAVEQRNREEDRGQGQNGQGNQNAAGQDVRRRPWWARPLPALSE